MDNRDAKALLKAIQKAQEPVGDLFSLKPALVLAREESEIVSIVRGRIERGEFVDYVTGNKLLKIYGRAYA